MGKPALNVYFLSRRRSQLDCWSQKPFSAYDLAESYSSRVRVTGSCINSVTCRRQYSPTHSLHGSACSLHSSSARLFQHHYSRLPPTHYTVIMASTVVWKVTHCTVSSVVCEFDVIPIYANKSDKPCLICCDGE